MSGESEMRRLALEHACPVCGAPPIQRCMVRTEYQTIIRKHPHSERVTISWRAHLAALGGTAT